jgi:hypothetical protein
MKKIQSKPVTSSRPKDTSLAAYKAWITELAKRLTSNQSVPELTEPEWIATWKAYWKEQSGG